MPSIKGKYSALFSLLTLSVGAPACPQCLCSHQEQEGRSMIGNGTRLEVSDNSGARIAQCINQTGKSFGVGDIINVTIKKATPRGKAPAGTVCKAVVVETRKELQRADGSCLRFFKNACVLLDRNSRQPLGTRVLGFATHELRARNMVKVLSLATRVL